MWALDSNVICFTGPRQSPININEKDTVEALSSIFVPMYQPVRDAAVLNTGHNLQVPGEFGFTLANDMKKWQAEQYHIHAPSEHFFEGKSFPLELHLVHTVGKEFSFGELDDFSLLSAGSRLKGNMSGRVPLEHGANRTKRFDLYNATVVGILFELGLTTNPCIGALLNPTVPGESCQRCLPHPVDLMRCFKRELSGPYYYYSGSFTTPPCTEDTQWYVMRKRATITAVDLDRFKTLAFPEPQNARPIQPRNGRVIYRV